MLSGVQNDTEKALFSEHIIQNAAKDVPSETRKIEYPESILDGDEGHAFAADFKERRIEKRQGLLVVLRELKGMESIEQCAKTCAEHGVPMTLVLEKSPDAGNAQYLRSLANRFYCLDEFLPCADWREFARFRYIRICPLRHVGRLCAVAFPIHVSWKSFYGKLRKNRRVS